MFMQHGLNTMKNLLTLITLFYSISVLSLLSTQSFAEEAFRNDDSETAIAHYKVLAAEKLK